MNAIVALFFIFLIVLGIGLYPTWVRWRRDRHKHRPLSPLQQSIVSNHLPFYDQLTPDERRRLQGHLQVFLAEK
nr:zinc-dependent peptidase [Oculatellaceae cyanobacterium Prado106]